MEHLVVFIDSGDTLVNEDSQVFDDEGYVIHADLIPGAKELIAHIKQRGYLLCLVCDGTVKTVKNTYDPYDLRKYFDGWVISEEVGVDKPDPLMFRTAMDSLHLTDADLHRIVMIGNNIHRDIKGANGMGITSILTRWSKNYEYTSDDPDEVPIHCVDNLFELPALLDRCQENLCCCGQH